MTHAHVITGSFGSGKTTAIRWLMAHKPQDELWVVILNEFTDAGLDALAVAGAARGRFDVRLVAGGCLCCVGELEFGRQLREILRNLTPARLLIEPSGAGHAADIVDELAIYETQRALTLDSVICLIDPGDTHRIWHTRNSNEWSQIQSADVLLLSKADLAGDTERDCFARIAAAQYPAKQHLGSVTRGELPPEAMLRYSRNPGFSLLRTVHPDPEAPAVIQPFAIGGFTGSESQLHTLGLWAVSWILPRELTFSRVVLQPRLDWLVEAYGNWLQRFKAVFRTGPGPSWMVQSHGRAVSAEDSAYRRDSRIEIVLKAEPGAGFLEVWRGLLRDAAIPP